MWPNGGRQGRSSATAETYMQCRTMYLLRLNISLHKEYEHTYPRGGVLALRPLIVHDT
jgi:hypothetical protein